MRSQNGKLERQIPGHRYSTFKPEFIAKNEKQLKGFDSRIISLHSRWLTTRDIQGYVKDVYGVNVSASFLSKVSYAVIDEVKRWQQRLLSLKARIVMPSPITLFT